jgi:hypothetical protein
MVAMNNVMQQTTNTSTKMKASLRKLEAAFLGVLVLSGAVHLAAVVLRQQPAATDEATATTLSAADEREAAEAWALAEQEGRVIRVGGANREPGDEIARTASR